MSKSASEQITKEVTSWPGVAAGPGRRAEFAFTVGRREIGHLHGDSSAHFLFPEPIWRELRDQGRIVEHPGFPGREGPAARRIEGDDNVRDVIELLWLNYDRVVAGPAGLRAPPERPAAARHPRAVEYRLTARGRRLEPLLRELVRCTRA
jgi:Family of unknown function (DUF5519)